MQRKTLIAPFRTALWLLALVACSDSTPPPDLPDPNPDPNPPPSPSDPAASRGSSFFGSAEQFNRYYTEPSWTPLRTLYISRTGTNTDATSNSTQNPTSTTQIANIILPGDMVIFLDDGTAYSNVNIQIPQERSGTYENPIVFASATIGGSRVHLQCRTNGNNASASCFNLEGANFIAITGFEMTGGDYGVRAVGLSYTSTEHQLGIAVLNNVIHEQWKDPIFTGQSDWSVVEGNEAYNAGSGDGHGIYISNGSDWGIIRQNELYQNVNSDLQINADPSATCVDVGIPYSSSACDGSANAGHGQGVSEFFLITENFGHHGDSGPNFTSVRNSLISHNIFGPYARHNTSFWQETNNADLGSSGNTIAENLFVGHEGHLVQLIHNASGNTLDGNIIMALNTSATASSLSIINIEVDASSGGTFVDNIYIGGYPDGHTILSGEDQRADFEQLWFTNNGFGRTHHPEDWTPSGIAPFNGFHNWEPPVLSP